MRQHRLGYLQARQMKVWLPDDEYRYAMQVGNYRSEGIQGAIERHLGVSLRTDAGNDEIQFRVLQFDPDQQRVYIQIDSTWVQPTRA